MKHTVVGRATLFAVAALFGCNDYVFDKPPPTSVKEVNRVEPTVTAPPADILFVVDNSGSMADEQEKLAQNFDRFIDAITDHAADYQIAVVTTDLEAPGGEQAGLREYSAKAAFPWTVDVSNVVSTCSAAGVDHGCFRGPDAGQRLVRSSATRDAQIAAFRDNVRVGSCGSGAERGLDAMVEALRKAAPGGCNEGFLRPEANLVIVLVSDEEDTDVPHITPTPISTLVDEVVRIKGDASKIRVATIVGERDGVAGRCGQGGTCGSLCATPPPDVTPTACAMDSQCGSDARCDLTAHQCQSRDLQFWNFCWWCSYYAAPDCCSANSGARYLEFARAMERAIIAADAAIPASGCTPADRGAAAACLIDSICQDDFSETLTKIAEQLVDPGDTFTLNPPAAYPPGVVVKLNGVALELCTADNAATCGFDVQVNADGLGVGVRLRQSKQAGDSLEIYYTTPE
ncbi:MAG: VWA domain-containing protein [Deltaproteobacteria bacterium]|nr:VWA domain-containing protein [Deltaproteobacteria bacterium]